MTIIFTSPECLIGLLTNVNRDTSESHTNITVGVIGSTPVGQVAMMLCSNKIKRKTRVLTSILLGGKITKSYYVIINKVDW